MLFLLTIVDSLHLVSSLLSFSLPSLSSSFYTYIYPFSLPFSLPLAQVMVAYHLHSSPLLLLTLQTSLVMSVYLTISISLERYTSVIYPLTALRLKISHSRYYFLFYGLPAILLSILVSLPTYFLVKTKCLHPVREDSFPMVFTSIL